MSFLGGVVGFLSELLGIQCWDGCLIRSVLEGGCVGLGMRGWDFGAGSNDWCGF